MKEILRVDCHVCCWPMTNLGLGTSAKIGPQNRTLCVRMRKPYCKDHEITTPCDTSLQAKPITLKFRKI